MTADEMSDRIAICELKARYCRFLDTKRWKEWGALFTDDFVLDTTGSGGPPPTAGRDAALASVRGSIETARTAHQVHTPEITLAGDRAEAIWAMQDRVVFEDGRSLTGYGHYAETYVRQAGGWRIASSRLTRLHIDFAPAPGA